MSQADKGQLWKGFNRVVEVARVEGGCIAYTCVSCVILLSHRLILSFLSSFIPLSYR